MIQREVNWKLNSCVTLRIIITLHKLQNLTLPTPQKPEFTTFRRYINSWNVCAVSIFLIKYPSQREWLVCFGVTCVIQFASLAWHTLLLDWENYATPINATDKQHFRKIPLLRGGWEKECSLTISKECGANSSSSYEGNWPLLSIANTAPTSRQEIESWQAAAEKERRDVLWQQRNAKSDTSQKILERSKLEKQSGEIQTLI